MAMVKAPMTTIVNISTTIAYQLPSENRISPFMNLYPFVIAHG
jgi:hypothetical protein